MIIGVGDDLIGVCPHLHDFGLTECSMLASRICHDDRLDQLAFRLFRQCTRFIRNDGSGETFDDLITTSFAGGTRMHASNVTLSSEVQAGVARIDLLVPVGPWPPVLSKVPAEATGSMEHRVAILLCLDVTADGSAHAAE